MTGWQRLEKAFAAGRPAEWPDLRGWKAGRLIESGRPNLAGPALLIGMERDRESSLINGGPGLQDIPARVFKTVLLEPPMLEVPEKLSPEYRAQLVAQSGAPAFWQEVPERTSPAAEKTEQWLPGYRVISDNGRTENIEHAFKKRVERQYRVFGPYLLARIVENVWPNERERPVQTRTWTKRESYAYFFKDVTPKAGDESPSAAPLLAKPSAVESRREPLLLPASGEDQGSKRLSVAAMVMIPLAAAGALIYLLYALEFLGQIAHWLLLHIPGGAAQ